MKISTGNNIHQYDSKIYRANKADAGVDEAVFRKKRDQILIDSGDRPIEEKRLVGELAYRVIKDVRTPTSQEKLESLRQQVHEGTYQIDVDKIVSRMLLERA